MKGVSSYEKDGKTYWKVYVNVVSRKSRKIREQKRIFGFESEAEAQKRYLKEYQAACVRLGRRENEGALWEEVIQKWEHFYSLYPSRRYEKGTIRDYVARMENWTDAWMKRPAKTLTPADGRELIEIAKRTGAGVTLQYQLKSTVNVIYNWGIENGFIPGKDNSPMYGLELDRKPEDETPEILNREQVVTLLEVARDREHEWYPVWKVGFHTGMRAGELCGLRREDMQLVTRESALELDKQPDGIKKNYGIIRVQRSWKKKERSYGATKANYWRTVPVSSQLYWFLDSYLPKANFGVDEYGARVFQDFQEFRRGDQARVLRAFCVSEKLPSIKFHTIRACFATLLIASGVPAVTVMKIGGWKDVETMQIYIRLSGIDEAGATEGLDLAPEVKPEPVTLPANVVNLFGGR